MSDCASAADAASSGARRRDAPGQPLPRQLPINEIRLFSSRGKLEMRVGRERLKRESTILGCWMTAADQCHELVLEQPPIRKPLTGCGEAAECHGKLATIQPL